MRLTRGFLSLSHMLAAAAAGGGSALDVIENGSISNQASLDLTNLSTTYRAYMLVIDNLQPVIDGATLQARTSTDNGSTWDSGASDYSYCQIRLTVGAGLTSGTSGGAAFMLLSGPMGNAAGEEGSFVMVITNPADSASPTQVLDSVCYLDTAGNFAMREQAARRNAAEANDGFQLFFSSGNISTANYTLYGLPTA